MSGIEIHFLAIFHGSGAHPRVHMLEGRGLQQVWKKWDAKVHLHALRMWAVKNSGESVSHGVRRSSGHTQHVYVTRFCCFLNIEDRVPYGFCRSICTCFVYMKSKPGVMAMLEAFREQNAKAEEPWEQRDFETAFRSRKDWNFTHYFLPRRTHPTGVVVRLEGDIRQNRFGARPHISHANGIGNFTAKVRNFQKQRLWEPNQDLPKDCSRGGLAHAREVNAHAARRSSGTEGNRHKGVAQQKVQGHREPKHTSIGEGEDPSRT